VSEIFPHLSTIVVIWPLFIREGTSNDHTLSPWNGTPAAFWSGSPAWVPDHVRVGTVNQNLPSYVVLYDQRGGPYGGPQNWASGYLPAAYQGTVFRPPATGAGT